MSLSQAAPAERRGWVRRALHILRGLMLATLAALTAPTALILLGWLQRRMRMTALRASGLPAAAPGWVMGPGGSGRVSRAMGGLGANIREGFLALVSLGLATLPFTAIWALSWWAGWENSFSKGYEQAVVGPALGLAGVAICMVSMVLLPLGLAHQAVEGRALSLFELRRVRSAFRETGWGYVMLAAATVVLALPVFAGRGLVAFAEGLVPGLADMTAEEARALAGQVALLKAAYLAAVLVLLRGWTARIYANAAALAAQRAPDLWEGTVMGALPRAGKPRLRLGRWLRTALLLVIWFGLVAQVFVGQFLNHAWWVWFTHPFYLLPVAI